MTIKVRLLVNSGTPDPEWELTGAEAERVHELLSRAQPVSQGVHIKTPGLGYIGLLIHDDQLEHGPIHISPGFVVTHDTRTLLAMPDGSSSADVEHRILSTIPDNMKGWLRLVHHHDRRHDATSSSSVSATAFSVVPGNDSSQGFSVRLATDPVPPLTYDKPHLLTTISSASAGVGTGVDAGICTGEPPLPDLEYWNSSQDRITQNNCYSYACNIVMDRITDPGMPTGHRVKEPITGPSVVIAAKDDGLEDLDEDYYPPDGSHKVALAIRPPDGGAVWGDYHWARLNAGGTWTHKRGISPVEYLTTVQGHIVTDPYAANANWREYDYYCFMSANTAKIQALWSSQFDL